MTCQVSAIYSAPNIMHVAQTSLSMTKSYQPVGRRAKRLKNADLQIINIHLRIPSLSLPEPQRDQVICRDMRFYH